MIILFLALCKATDVKKFDMHTVIKTETWLDGIIGKVFGSLAYVTSDNLSSHPLGGFNSCVSPKLRQPCRFCMISGDQLQETVVTEQLDIRA